MENLHTSVHRRRWQQEHLATLSRTVPGTPIILPELQRGTFDRDSIATLADHIERAVSSP